MEYSGHGRKSQGTGLLRSRPDQQRMGASWGTGWTGPGGGGRGTPGQEEGVFVQSWRVLTHQSWSSGPGRGIKPEPVTCEWPGKAAHGGLAPWVLGRNVSSQQIEWTKGQADPDRGRQTGGQSHRDMEAAIV